MTKRSLIFLAALTGAAACGGAKSADEASTGTPVPSSQDSLTTLTDAAAVPIPNKVETVTVVRPSPPPATKPATKPPVTKPVPTPAPVTSTPSAPPATKPVTAAVAKVESGHTIGTTMIDSVHSRYTKVGDPVKVRVSGDVLSSDGRVVIPAGSVITLHVSEIAQADSKGQKGTLALTGREVAIDGRSYAINAAATDYEYEMKARGVQSGDVAKTGAGAVAGAIIGRVAGGKKGTVIGAAAGGVVGAAVANSTANRDIIVHAGQKMTLTLREDFARP